MWNRQELKMRGKMAFKKNYASSVAVTLLMGIISSIFSGSSSGANFSGDTQTSGMGYQTQGYDSIQNNLELGIFAGILGLTALVIALIGGLLDIFVENVLKVGGNRFFIQNQTGQPGIGEMLYGFRSGHYGNIVLTMFLKDLFTTLWTCLLIVPGIIKHYEYRMIPYILAENPGMNRKEAFAISKRMMNGQKWEAFVLDLSFLGWNLLSVFTCGILAVFYVNPYFEATYAEMYSFNKMKAFQEGYIR